MVFILYFNAMLQSDWLIRGSINHILPLIQFILPLIQSMASNAQNEVIGPGKTSQYQDFFPELEPALPLN